MMRLAAWPEELATEVAHVEILEDISQEISYRSALPNSISGLYDFLQPLQEVAPGRNAATGEQTQVSNQHCEKSTFVSRGLMSQNLLETARDSSRRVIGWGRGGFEQPKSPMKLQSHPQANSAGYLVPAPSGPQEVSETQAQTI